MNVAMYPTRLHDPRTVPSPPRLHWAVVLVLSMLTRSLFSEIWLVVQANWIRKVTGRSGPMIAAVANLVMLPFLLFSAITTGAIVVALGGGVRLPEGLQGTIGILAVLIVVTVYIVTVFKVRNALQAEPIGLSLSGVMTFLFGPIYFQYFLHDYVLPSAAEVYGQIGEAPAYVPPTWREPSR